MKVISLIFAKSIPY